MKYLVIAEKPSVARSISKVIGAYKHEDGYLEGGDCVVSWCLGHLAEYENTGEGADISQRVSWARQLSDKDVKMLVKSEFYTFSNTWDLY